MTSFPETPAFKAEEGASSLAIRGHTRLLNHVAFANEILVVTALVADLVITFANTIGRYAFNSGMTWAPEASLICMAMMTFPGAAAFYRRGAGMAYTALVDMTG